MFIIYGSENCSACSSAKQLLEVKGFDYAYEDLMEIEMAEMQKLMKVAGTPFRTVPQIFHVGFGDTFEYIGGFDQLKEHLDAISADQ